MDASQIKEGGVTRNKRQARTRNDSAHYRHFAARLSNALRECCFYMGVARRPGCPGATKRTEYQRNAASQSDKTDFDFLDKVC
jgi:hypothetical protein